MKYSISKFRDFSGIFFEFFRNFSDFENIYENATPIFEIEIYRNALLIFEIKIYQNTPLIFKVKIYINTSLIYIYFRSQKFT